MKVHQSQGEHKYGVRKSLLLNLTSIARLYAVLKNPTGGHHPRNARTYKRRVRRPPGKSHGEHHRFRKCLSSKVEPLIASSLQVSEESSRKRKEIPEKTPESR